ncbi:MAG: radical SAM protein, partial [Candidatus Omnitrophica bacterium]|nr:radical SAM protein [Candidatus Omnitrophota bacterium]
MKNISLGHFYGRLQNKKEHYSWTGQIELTYRCNLNCIHCYCKGSEDKNNELTTQEWKKIINEIRKEGCIWLTFTGGDPLVRDDFLEIYSYAKEKGFIITLFTNGQAFTDEIIDYLVNSPPFSIEITLNGLSKDTHESITQTPGSFSKVVNAIGKLAEKKPKLILKTNCLKQNKYEIGKIKAFTEELIGKPFENKYYFKYDPMIYPRLNGDKTPANFRLSFEEILEVKKQDPDIWDEYQRGLHQDFPDLKRDKTFLY